MSPVAALALDEQRAEVQDFIRHMAERHGFAPAELGTVFRQVESRPSIVAAMKRRRRRRWRGTSTARCS